MAAPAFASRPAGAPGPEIGSGLLGAFTLVSAYVGAYKVKFRRGKK
jgi:hypothetical protein